MSLSFGIYKRKVVFFFTLFLATGGIFYFINRQLSSASINELAVPASSGEYNINININKDAQVLVENKNYNNLLSPGKNADEFRYIAAENEGIFIDQLNVYIHLPEPVTLDEINQRVYAIHGVAYHNYFLQDPQTLVFTASNLSPAATFTIVVELPKGTVSFPWYKMIVYYLTNLPPSVWLIISTILPAITLIFLLIVFGGLVSKWRNKKPKNSINKLPDNLSPSEVEVLVDGKVSARSIAAILLDLAQRDYLVVLNKGNKFSFAKKKSVDLDQNIASNLKPFEKLLLSKIFTDNKTETTTEDIQIRIGRHIFSKKIAEVYLKIYENIATQGYFLENPSKMHSKYRFAGLIFFFIGLIGFIYGVFFAPDPKFYLLFWAGMIFASFIIMRMSPQLPARTAKGKSALYEWLKFKNYLIDPTLITYLEGTQDVFEKFLPYAIALRCESEWANRFIEHPFKKPDWYNSYQQVVILEDFVASLFPMVGYVAKELASSREPIV